MVELNQDNQQEPITSLNHSHNHFFTYPEIDENSRFFSAQDHNFPALNAGGSPQKEKKKKKTEPGNINESPFQKGEGRQICNN